MSAAAAAAAVVAATGEWTEIEGRDGSRGLATRYWANGLRFFQIMGFSFQYSNGLLAVRFVEAHCTGTKY